MNKETEMTRLLKRFSLFIGIGLVALSIYFSWDGLDQTVTGSNPTYTDLAKVIGFILAGVFSLIQFIFNTDYNSLNTTLKLMGGGSYIYSIYTNKLGIAHLFGFSDMTSWMIAIFMDVLPEALIAWSMGDSLRGDLIGNMTKFILGQKDNPQMKVSQSYQFRSLPADEPPGHKNQNHQFNPKHNRGKPNKPIFPSIPKADKNKDDTKPKFTMYRGE
jgi:hypothetical protein